MPRRPLENLTESMFYVLLALRRGPMCGMEIAAFLERATNGRLRIGPATLYTVLSKFEEVKYIEEIAVEGRKRTYRITRRGVEAYNAEINRLTACLQDAETIGGLLHD
ncbi:MAG: helix-turn-helix transcriptional regulator [Clostridiales bacterium]|nr:helix-turn-helix transcriptional regulator [Clostridiales bacterium]